MPTQTYVLTQILPFFNGLKQILIFNFFSHLCEHAIFCESTPSSPQSAKCSFLQKNCFERKFKSSNMEEIG